MTTLCPRCTSEVFDASARCRTCNLPRRDFAAFTPPTTPPGHAPPGHAPPGHAPPGYATPAEEPEFVLRRDQPQPQSPSGSTEFAVGLNVPGGPPKPRPAGGSSIFELGLDLPDANAPASDTTPANTASSNRVDAGESRDAAAASQRADRDTVFSLGEALADAVNRADAAEVCLLSDRLGNHGGPWATALLKVAADEINVSRAAGPRAKAAVLSAIGRAAEASDLPQLVDALKAGKTPAIRVSAAAAIGALGDAAGVGPLREATRSGVPVSMAAIKALGEIMGSQSAAALYEVLSSDVPAERAQAIRSLVKLKDPKAIRRVRLLTTDEDERVARVATSAVAALRDAGGEPPNVETEPAAEAPAKVAVAKDTPAAAVPAAVPAKADEPKPKRKRKPLKIRKTRTKRVRPSWVSFESLQSISLSELASAAAGSRTVVGGLALVLALAAGGWTFLSGSISAMASGRNDEILMRGLVSGVSISGDGGRVAVGRTKNVLDVYDVGGGYVLDQKTPASGTCLMSADGSRSVCGASGGGAMWDLAQKQSTPVAGFEMAAMTADRSLAVVGDGVGAFSRLDLATGEMTPLFEVESRPRPTAVATNADVSQVLVGCNDGSVRIWSEEGGLSSAVLAGPPNGVASIAYAPDGERVAVAGILGSLFLFEKGNPRPVLEHGMSTPKRVSAIRFVDGERLLAVAGDHAITLDITSGEEVANVRLPGAETQYVSMSDDGRRVAAASEDSDFVRVYDTSDGTALDAIKLD